MSLLSHGYGCQVMHLLRSGLFYAQHLKRAAARIRESMGNAYVVLHVRRADRIAHGHCTPSTCVKRDVRTQPAALLRALRRFFAEQTTVYIASTEKPGFFSALRPHYNLKFAEDFPAEFANLTNNYELYAIESLLSFGAGAYMETNQYAHVWFNKGCFPARERLLRNVPRKEPQRLRVSLNDFSGTSVGNNATDDPRVVPSRCDNNFGSASITVHDVSYGTACGHNPPCGDQMSLTDNYLLYAPDKPPRCTAKCALVGTLAAGGARE